MKIMEPKCVFYSATAIENVSPELIIFGKNTTHDCFLAHFINICAMPCTSSPCPSCKIVAYQSSLLQYSNKAVKKTRQCK